MWLSCGFLVLAGAVEMFLEPVPMVVKEDKGKNVMPIQTDEARAQEPETGRPSSNGTTGESPKLGAVGIDGAGGHELAHEEHFIMV